MSNFKVWVECIKHALLRRGAKLPKDLDIKVENKEVYHQASLSLPHRAVLFGEPALSEDNAMKALLDEINHVSSE